MRLNALWVEGDLSYMEQLCLLSALDVGHKVTLWTYGEVTGVPRGVEVADAHVVMPRSMIVEGGKREKRVDVGSDFFRLMLMRTGYGCYIDCDMLLLKPIPDMPYIFGLEEPDQLCNAVLRLPPNCEIIEDIFNMVEGTVILPWWSRSRKLKQHLRALVGKDKKIGDVHRTSYGPTALTYFAKKYDLMRHALPNEAFYPNHPSCAADIFHHASLVEAKIKPNTIAVHLWHNEVKGYKHRIPIIPGTFLHKHCSRLGVDVAQPIGSVRRQDLRESGQAQAVLR